MFYTAWWFFVALWRNATRKKISYPVLKYIYVLIGHHVLVRPIEVYLSQQKGHLYLLGNQLVERIIHPCLERLPYVLASRTNQGTLHAVWVTHNALILLLLINEPSRVFINTHDTRKRSAGGFFGYTGQITKFKTAFDKVYLRKWFNVLVKVGGIRAGWNQQMNLNRLIGIFGHHQRFDQNFAGGRGTKFGAVYLC